MGRGVVLKREGVEHGAEDVKQFGDAGRGRGEGADEAGRGFDFVGGDDAGGEEGRYGGFSGF